MTDDIMKNWEDAAWDLPGPVERLKLPAHVIAGECIDVSRFCTRNWEPLKTRRGQLIHPGLKSAVGRTFGAGIGQELLELHDAFQLAQARFRLLVDGPRESAMEHARFCLNEIRSTLEWHFDDGVDDVSDAQLVALARAHEGAFSQDAVASALFEYIQLAERHVEAIAGLGGFDAGLISEGRKVARELRESSAGPATVEDAPALAEAHELRDRIGMLISERLRRVRNAARFVLRGRPELLREVTSDYVRRQRATHRGKTDDAAPSSPANGGVVA